MFTDVEVDSPRNLAFSLGESAGGSGENRVNFADRGVLTSKEMLRRSGRKIKPLGRAKIDDASCFIDTGFNGGGVA